MYVPTLHSRKELNCNFLEINCEQATRIDFKHFFLENSLDAGIQDSSTSISIVVILVMKVTNVYKHEIVDTRA